MLGVDEGTLLILGAAVVGVAVGLSLIVGAGELLG
jgi:hypothetical protein